ncbi:MoaD/ThiS family protein [Halobium palmae]|uniref:MoaD/ThiS family protein n=1 Tax=Halobium palmae TaxID=1776492 RepID=A0ABD5RWM5_9EURY
MYPVGDRIAADIQSIQGPTRRRGCMQVSITLYGPPRDAVGEKTVVRDVEPGTTVSEAFGALFDAHRGPESSPFAPDGSVANGLTVTVNGESIERREGADTELADGDELRVAPAFEGG